ncbi:hypothetical protein LTR78_005969 [Recurvomyces mirabilis]|uniref:non-specific serine/threonine protein kinase n=1 Tax=Recurvomyces mirabilis TaxID=574656 RepID=A0AAE1C0L9_9PEZI|nr:hypothetical protein LTR78_005969 [Recurvomyces mirabilis]
MEKMAMLVKRVWRDQAGRGGRGEGRGKVLAVEDAHGDEEEEEEEEDAAAAGTVAAEPVWKGRPKKGKGRVATDAADAPADDDDHDAPPMPAGATRKQRLDARLAKKAEIDRAAAAAGAGVGMRKRGRGDDDAAEDDVDVDVAGSPPSNKKGVRRAGPGPGKGDDVGREAVGGEVGVDATTAPAIGKKKKEKIWHWVGDPKDLVGRQHVEIACMGKLREVLGGQDYTVALRHAEVDRRKRLYRFYMAYCPHGSLHELIKEYLPRRSWLLVEEGMERCENCGEEHMTHKQPPGIAEKDIEGGKYGERFVPEPCLWYVFEALARACIAMKSIPANGSDTNKGEAASAAAAKQCIIHRDLKPANIFLHAPDNAGDGEDKYPPYPRPRVGDFGISLLTSANDQFNPLSYMIGEGTPNWIAPETQPLVDKATAEYADLGRIDGKANVWGIGAILGALISREAKLQGMEYEEGEDILPKIQLPVFTDKKRIKAVRKLYSSALLDLVNACLAYRPANRPSADELLQEILRRTEGEYCGL